MKYQKFDQKSYKIHTIKTNRFKTTKIEAVFRLNINKETLHFYSFLAALLNESSKKYPTRKNVAIRCEELYKAYYYTYANKVGNALNVIFSLNFINPEYIKEDNYLTDIIKFFFEMIKNPNIKNEEFDIDTFNIVKNNILLDIESINENSEKKAINNALITLDKDSISSCRVLGTKEDVNNITPDNIYKYYLDLMNKASIDIFIIGNTNMENIVNTIKNTYHNHMLRDNKITYYIENKTHKKVTYKEDSSKFMQSELVMLFNLINLTKDEKEITFHLLNYILGSGGLSSKLYRYVRGDNSYCYQISSMYFKYDNLLCITSSLAKENIKETISLIRKAISEMQKGIFTEDDINDAKKNMLLSLNVNKNNPSAILASYEFKEFLNNYMIDEKIDLINKITKKDIVKLASKIVENTIYVLSEENNERD